MTKKPKAVKAWAACQDGEIYFSYMFPTKKKGMEHTENQSIWSGVDIIPVLITPITRRKK